MISIIEKLKSKLKILYSGFVYVLKFVIYYIKLVYWKLKEFIKVRFPKFYSLLISTNREILVFSGLLTSFVNRILWKLKEFVRIRFPKLYAYILNTSPKVRMALLGVALAVITGLAIGLPLLVRYINTPRPPAFSGAPRNSGYQFQARDRRNGVVSYVGTIENNAPSVKAQFDSGETADFALTETNQNISEPERSGNTVTFKNVRNDVDLKYETLVNGIKESLAINSPQEGNAFTFVLNTSNASPRLLATNIYSNTFYDENGEFVFGFVKPYAFDANGERTDNLVLSITKTPGDSHYSVRVIVNEKWLKDSARVYPITIDPTILYDTASELSFGQFDRVLEEGSTADLNNATGGTISTLGDYKVHTFTSSGTFTPNATGTVEVLVVAGGGGGANTGSGGGAGGYVYNSGFPVAAQAYTVTVGNGGSGGLTTAAPGQQGQNSVFSTITAVGGGAGVSHGGNTGGAGGSGGGGSIGTGGSAAPGGAATSGQGNNGGAGFVQASWIGSSGGGGGAGAVGSAGCNSAGCGKGGDGLLNSISGTPTYYAGGGGGGEVSGGFVGAGGLGGGGSAVQDNAGTSGAANTGGGGGGGSYTGTYFNGGNGGSGIVIIRYKTFNTKISTYYQELAADQSTVGLWHMNEATGTTAVSDSSGLGNTGTSSSNSNVTTGQLGNARTFDGSKYISINDSGSLQLASALTVEAWFKTSTQPASNTCIVRKDSASGTRYFYGLIMTTEGKVAAQYYNTTTNYIQSSIATVNDGKWHHAANVVIGTFMSLYLDGVYQGTTTTVGQVIPNGQMGIGGCPPYVGGGTWHQWYTGDIDDVRISNVARSSEEIRMAAQRRPYGVYTSDVMSSAIIDGTNQVSWSELGVTTGDGETLSDATNLVAQWNFNETSGTTASVAAGSCGTTCNGTLSNFASTGSQDAAAGSGWTANNKRWGAGALMFDGSNDFVACSDANCGGVGKLDFDTGSFTLESWFKTSSSGTYKMLQTKRDSGATNNAGYVFFLDPSNLLTCRVGDGTNSAAAASSGNFGDGKWHHATCVVDRSGKTITTYIDGKPGNPVSTSSVGSSNNAIESVIGAFGSGGSYIYHFNGVIDSSRAYSRALSPGEILSNYNAGNLEIQTRVGNTTDPNDGTWEEWRPTASEAQIDSLDGYSPSGCSGGTAIDGGKAFMFTSSDTFTCTSSGNVEVLVVAGGGGGGSDMGGGGGGGGVINKPTYDVAANTPITVTVGNGGAGASAGIGQAAGINGQNSVFGTLTAIGGGGGASAHDRSTSPAGSGGSGGGSSGGAQPPSGGQTGTGGYGGGAAGTGTSGQGFNGSFGVWAWYPGGGGGAGGAGSTNPATGGIGYYSTILGPGYYWGGGGGGSGYTGIGGNGGAGGGGGGGVGTTFGGSGLNPGSPGGGGCSSCWTNTPGGNGGVNTGGGGGGGAHYNSNNTGGNGGSGIVIVRLTPLSKDTVTKLEGTGSQKLDTSILQADANTIALYHLDETGGTGAYLKNSSSYAKSIYTCTGADQTYTVPAGVTSVNVKMWGAGGGAGNNIAGAGQWNYGFNGGGGGYTTGDIAVTPGQVLTVVAGCGGGHGNQSNSSNSYGGGGLSCGGTDCRYGGQGGGRSAIQYNSTDFMTAGGGGGGGSSRATNGQRGGAGGGSSGEDGASYTAASRGRGATQDAAGTGGSGTIAGTDGGIGATIINDGTGGTITHAGGYTIHTFTANETFNPTVSRNVEYLLVAGGASGGGYCHGSAGGGGGAGGLVESSISLSATSYPVVIGQGGNAATNVVGADGENTTFAGQTAIGGGGGGYGGVNGRNGGSGGGAGNGASPGTGSQGGNGGPAGIPGGGGGGRGGNGQSYSSANGGVGGAGFTSAYFGGCYSGGGGGGGGAGGYEGQGGTATCGGGGGGAWDNIPGVAATENTGGGGGGVGRCWLSTTSSGKGGSGIAKIRYLTQYSGDKYIGGLPGFPYSYGGGGGGGWYGGGGGGFQESNDMGGGGGGSGYVGGEGVSNASTTAGSARVQANASDSENGGAGLGGGGEPSWGTNNGAGGKVVITANATMNHATPNSTTVVNGIFGKARNFDGTSSNPITVPNSASFDFGNRDFSIDWWEYRTDAGNTRATMQRNYSGDGVGYTPWIAGYSNGTNLLFYATSCGVSCTWDVADAKSMGPVTLNQWVHLAVTRKGTTFTTYKNGVAQTTWTSSLAIQKGTGPLVIGQYWTGCGGSYCFKGKLDEIRFSSVARTQEELAEAYRMGRDYYVNHAISADLSSAQKLAFNVAADRPGTYLEALIGNNPYANYQPDANTVGLWHLDELNGSGTCCRDSSGNRNPIIGGVGPVETEQGVIGKARNFNGTTSYLSVPSNALLNVSTAFTLQAWIKTTSTARQFAVAKFSNASPGRAYAFGTSAGKLYVELAKTDASFFNSGSPGVLVNDGKWHLIALTYTYVGDGTSIAKFYVDGVLDGQFTNVVGPIQSSVSDLTIGRRNYDGFLDYFSGSIDEVSVSNIARSAADIRTAYEVGKRSHEITIDFGAKLDSGNLIANSNDKSFTVDATYYGLANKGSNLYQGDKIIVKENYEGTTYIAQGTVNGIVASTGAVTVTSWDNGSTFPSSGFTANADVFKWQKEYFDLTGSLSTQRNGVTKLTLRPTDGNEGRNVWLDNIQSIGSYLTTPAGSDILSSTGRQYFQYRTIFSSNDYNVSPALTTTTSTFASNTPLAPTMLSPTVNDTTGTSIQWNFSNPGGSPTGFKLFDGLSNTETPSQNIADCYTNSAATSCTETGLTPNTSYSRRMVAYNASGNSPFSLRQTGITLAAVPPAPVPSSPTSTSVVITPGAGTNPATTELVVYQQTGTSCTGTGGNYLKADGTSNGATAVWLTAASWGNVTVSGLDLDNVQYIFCTKARNMNNIETGWAGNATAGGYVNDVAEFTMVGDMRFANAKRKHDGNVGSTTCNSGGRCVTGLDWGSSGWWKLDEASGNAVDSSGNNYSGTPTGTSIVAGKYGSARSFVRANSDVIKIGDVLDMGTSDYTVEAWFKATDTTDYGYIISKLYTASGFACNIVAGNEVLNCTFNFGNAESVQTQTAVTDGNWHFFAVVFDRSGNLSLYLDGVLQDTANISAGAGVNIGNTDYLTIGGSCGAGGTACSTFYFDGVIDDVRIYKAVLSEHQMQEDMNNNPAGKFNVSRFIVQSGTLTLMEDETMSVGELILSGGTIVIPTGAQIKIGSPVWYSIADSDGDSYFAGSTASAFVGTPPAVAKRKFLGAPSDSSYDCNDANASVHTTTPATGGTVTTPTGYIQHTFTSNGALIYNSNSSVQYFLVGGGGSGGGGGHGAASAGGGSGGVVENTITLSAVSYPVVIGQGGTATTTIGNDGGSTTFAGLTAIGGGGGAVGSQNGHNGGSGGGGAYAASPGSGSQGGNGGAGNYSAGGGGGGGGNGGSYSGTSGGAGGAGRTSVYFGGCYGGGGGGGGGDQSGGGPGGIATCGGGGGGGTNIGDPGADATANTGGGGGGVARCWLCTNYSGDGGSGKAIIRYPTCH